MNSSEKFLDDFILLKFWSKREVACIAQAWYDISVVVKNGVDGSYPQSYIIGEYTA